MKEQIYKWLAWKSPEDLVMWATVRLLAYATQGKYSNQEVPDLLAMDALKRWEDA